MTKQEVTLLLKHAKEEYKRNVIAIHRVFEITHRPPEPVRKTMKGKVLDAVTRVIERDFRDRSFTKYDLNTATGYKVQSVNAVIRSLWRSGVIGIEKKGKGCLPTYYRRV